MRRIDKKIHMDKANALFEQRCLTESFHEPEGYQRGDAIIWIGPDKTFDGGEIITKGDKGEFIGFENGMNVIEMGTKRFYTNSGTFQKSDGLNEQGGDEDTYFETLSSALDYVRKQAESMGLSVDEDDIFAQFGTGGISYGTTKSANINLLQNGNPILSGNGKPLNRSIRVVIYRMDSGKYELTSYKSW
jgi:hypothetical protein